MARGKKESKRQVENYVHKGRERLNNPPVGLVTPDTDKDTGKKSYAYDPHRDPQLVWARKAEHTSFEVPTVSLHVHERIDPLSAQKSRLGDLVLDPTCGSGTTVYVAEQWGRRWINCGYLPRRARSC